MARRFGMTANAVRQAAFALRQRLGTLLKREVRSVVSTKADLDDEFRYLIQLLSAPADSA